MGKLVQTIVLHALCIVISGVVSGCGKDIDYSLDEISPVEIFCVETFQNNEWSCERKIDLGSNYTIEIPEDGLQSSINLSVGQKDVKDRLFIISYDPFEGTNWKIVPQPDAVPSFLSLTFNPQSLSSSESSTNLSIRTIAPVPRIEKTYTVKVEANRADFDNPRSFYLQFHVRIPQSNIHAEFQTDTLTVAPGLSATSTMRLNGIAAGEKVKLTYDKYSMLNDEIQKSWISLSNNVLSSSNDSTVWTFSPPASANPNQDEEGVLLTVRDSLSDVILPISNSKNRLVLEIAGYTIPAALYNKSMKLGDTLTLPIVYSVRGNGVFTPKLIPPNTIPANDVVIIQDVGSTVGQKSVSVIYKVFFKSRPASGFVRFEVGGTISYGKAVPKTLQLQVN